MSKTGKFKFIGVTKENFDLEFSQTIDAISEYVSLHAENFSKCTVFDEDGNLILFLDTKYFDVENFFDGKTDIPF